MDDYTINRLRNEEEISCESDPDAPIVRYYRTEESEIEKFCMEHYITCFLSGKSLVIETPASLWKIITNGQRNLIFLYHRNDSRSDDYEEPDALVPHYHAQSCRRSTIMGYLEYIVAHDEYRDKNPAERPKKKKKTPRKGTRRYRAEERKKKRRQTKEENRRVRELLDSLHEESDSK